MSPPSSLVAVASLLGLPWPLCVCEGGSTAGWRTSLTSAVASLRSWHVTPNRSSHSHLGLILCFFPRVIICVLVLTLWFLRGPSLCAGVVALSLRRGCLPYLNTRTQFSLVRLVFGYPGHFSRKLFAVCAPYLPHLTQMLKSPSLWRNMVI